MRDRAFSLVELLVVIAILAVLIGILFSVTGTIREKSNQALCITQMRSIGQALNNYAIDNENRYPVTYGPLRNPPDKKTWMTKVATYAGMPEDSMGFPPLPRSAGIFVCPSFPKSQLDERIPSYRYNLALVEVWQYQRQLLNMSQFFLVVEAQGVNTEVFSIKTESVDRRHSGKSANYLYADGRVENIDHVVGQDDPRWGLKRD